MKAAFIGLGSMGSGMARNLIEAGHTLTVYNRTRSRAEDLGAQGAKVAESPGQAAKDAEVVITMLADDKALEETVFGAGNVLESLRPDAIHVSMSTISVALSRRLAEAHRERNSTMWLRRCSAGRMPRQRESFLWWPQGLNSTLNAASSFLTPWGRGHSLPGRKPTWRMW